MSFFRIEDPEKREAMVEDYVATLKRLQERDMSKRTNDLYSRQRLDRHFAPVVESHDEMSNEITKALKPIKDEVQELNRKFLTPVPKFEGKPIPKFEDDDDVKLPRDRRRTFTYGPRATIWKDRMLAQDPDVDKTFGLHFLLDGTTAMGRSHVDIDGDDIIIGDKEYPGTDGLWSLLTDTTEDQIRNNYTKDDMKNYADMLWSTSVLHRDSDHTNPHPRSNSSWKWKGLLQELWYAFKNEPVPSVEKSDRSIMVEQPEDDQRGDEGGDTATHGGSGLQDPINTCKVYIQKKGKCYRVQKAKGKGYLLTSQRTIPHAGSGLFLRQHGQSERGGHGLLLGRNSPFKNIPILKWLL